MINRTETWKKYGQVEVTRYEKGRFVSWRKVVRIRMFEKRVAVYQYCSSPEGVQSRRYQLSGRGKDLQKAVIFAFQRPPKRRFLTIGAREFLKNPYKHIDMEARWIGRPEVES